MASFVNESSEDNSNTRDSDTDHQHGSDSLDLSELNNLSNAENQGLLLLQRLQQLKVWQARQEALLLEEQRQQISLKLSEVAAGTEEQQEQVEDAEDDTTISSMDSDHEQEQSLPWISSLGPSPSPDRTEDLPLSGGGKTFAQLMAEKLTGKENEGIATADQKKVVTPKPFLKRGSGLTRFNLPADPAKQPGRGRSRAEPRNEQAALESKQITPEPVKPSVTRKVAPKYLNTSKNANLKQSPVKSNKKLKPVAGQSPPSKLKLKPSKSSSELSKPRSQPPPRPARFNLCDSVENSFCDKLTLQAQRHQKDLKELEVFQLLEDAANDSSFCSNSSKIKSLVSNAMLPTPNKNPNLSTAKTSFASSTPAPHLAQLSSSTPLVTPNSANVISNAGNKDTDPYDPSMGESLMEDIRKFLQAKVASNESEQTGKAIISYESASDSTTHVENDSEWTDESDDSTLDGEDDLSCQSIGRNWQDKLLPAGYENKENVGSAKMLEFSPPEKLPADPPSHLIWEIFGRERELRRKQQEEQNRKDQMIKKTEVSQPVRRNPAGKSVPLKVRFDNVSKPEMPATGPGVRHVAANILKESEGSQDMSYQSTLLHMRVVELEQEIENFKKENKKITILKKKLQADKDKLAKELNEFETLKETEKKKMEEDKRRIKRDKMLLEKGKKDQQKGCDDCEEKEKQAVMLTNELKTKEMKWAEEVTKLKEQLKKSNKDQQELRNENQKLRLKKVNSKVGVGGGRVGGPEVIVDRHREEEDSGFRTQPGSLSSSEQQSSEEDMLDMETRKTITKTIYNTLCQGDSQVHSPVIASSPDVKENCENEKGAREKRFSDGRVEVWYSNGNRKEVSADGSCVKLFYYNGDVKETHSQGLVRYLYSHTQTWHTTHTDGREILQFSNGQEETRLPDGSSSISFPDGSVKNISPGGVEKITFPDSTVVTVQPNGDRVLQMPNGQVEEHTSQHKKRTYPDGTVKIVHMDGRQETRYAGGRVRVKDSKGVLIKDTGSGGQGQ